MRAYPKACLIGAGSSGITVAKSLRDAEITFDWFEASDRIGGNWAYRNPNGMSSAYDTLHINTSRPRMEFRDYPMPASYPDFPHHTQIAAYFEDYVDHFGLRELISFGCRVAHAAREADGTWRVKLADGSVRRYDVLLVANGHHWDPRWPEPPIPGDFAGEVIHAHDYVEQAQVMGRRVVVLGMGNSAMDIAVAASYVAKSVTVAARRGAHIVPKYVFGRPLDQFATLPWVPLRIRQLTTAALLRLYRGSMTRYGLPKPDHRLLEAHPTVSDDFLSRVTHGEIDVKPMIARLDGDRVHFVDGSAVDADLVVYATGYKISFPFLDPDFLAAPDNEIALYRNAVRPDVDNLFFIALVQPLGATMPIAEAQGRWIAAYLTGRYRLPSHQAMEAWIAANRERMQRRYVASKRHTIQVDFDDYLWSLRVEFARGRLRAAVKGLRPRRRPSAGEG